MNSANESCCAGQLVTAAAPNAKFRLRAVPRSELDQVGHSVQIADVLVGTVKSGEEEVCGIDPI
jgi:hypothetical protein